MTKVLEYDDLALIAQGHAAFQLLWSGVNLNVFDYLSEHPGCDFESLRAGIGLELQPAKVLIIGLTSLGIIEKDGDSYRNAEVVEQTMVSGRPGNMREVLGWQHHICYPGLHYFLDSLKQNANVGLQHFQGDEDNLYARLAHTPELEKVFQDAMSSLSNTANELLAREVTFDDINHLVDAGGGVGTNAITLAKANPNLRVTVFDSPTVCERANANIADQGMSDRVDTYPGDFFVRDFPEGIDAIMFAHMMTIWTPEKDTELLKRAYDALPVGGKVIIYNMMAYDDDTGPKSAALGSPYFLAIATGQGRLYSWQDYEGFLKEAGFSQTVRKELPRDHGVLVGVK
ncbi:MAG: acetylserotonin O-methyltransferase [Pseudomonadales bacterium]|nr:acetylserotonin O-methyltransferase [Pseudomonadales bacterium]